jgi:serine/threonine protein kinase
MSQVSSQSTPLLNGRYRIEQKLGTNRLAVVYRAFDERLQRQVLVHMLRRELVEQEPVRQRFMTEAASSARRSHRSLLEVYDSGELAKRPYMVTEYASGRPLRELGPLSLDDALLYLRQLIGAVAVCQAAGVSHPPLTSSNVILIDAGHVELIENWQTSPEQLAHELASYRAPERASGQNIPAGAVYALGLLLLEMLAGRRLVTGADPQTTAQLHATIRLPKIAELRPTLSVPALDALIQRATARDPAQRPPNAASFSQELDDVRRMLSSETKKLDQPPTRPPSLRQQVSDTMSRAVMPPPRREPVPIDAPPFIPAQRPQRYPNLEEDDTAPTRGRSKLAPSPWRTFGAFGVMAVVFVLVACLAVSAANRLFNIGLPSADGLFNDLPSIEWPTIDLGIQWPEWLTGVIEGAGEVLVVNSGELPLIVRSEPDSSGTPLAELANGTKVRYLSGPQIADAEAWVQVRARIGEENVEGWVAARFLRTEIGDIPFLNQQP